MSDIDSNEDIEVEVEIEDRDEEVESDTTTENSDDVSEEEENQTNLQKIEASTKTHVIQESHPELQVHNNDDIQRRCEITGVNDPNHQTNAILSKFEKSRILGERAKQLADGDDPLIAVDKIIIDPYIIAEMELKARVLPFIIFRPIGTEGEYWRLNDLEDIMD